MPNQITENINSIPVEQRVRYASFYAQESWTMGRITLQGALRYDRAWSYFPEVTVGPVRFFPNPVTYPKTRGVTGYNDITPRGGLAWDVLGNGKTSLKLNFGKYLQAAQNGLATRRCVRRGRLATTVTRAWTDGDGDFVPDCDLTEPAGARTAATPCGQISDLGLRHSSGSPARCDDKLISGWGVRPGDWQFGVSDPAGADAARVGGDRLPRPLADQLHLGRQRPAGADRLRHVQRDGAERSASA